MGETACWLFLVAVVCSVFEVISDSVFNAPTIWVHDTTIMLCASCFLLGGAYAMQRREHIRITLVTDLLPEKWRIALEIVTSLLALFYMVLLSYFATAQAIDSIAVMEYSGRAWDFPMPMVVRSAFGFGALLLSAQIASHAYVLCREFAAVMSGPAAPSAPSASPADSAEPAPKPNPFDGH